VLRDIVKLWTVAGQRYLAGRHELAGVQGPEYSLYDDFPEELNEVRSRQKEHEFRETTFLLAG
jgi:hypothetical protein